MEEIEINIFGRVQGVGLRYNIRYFCEKNKLKGFVLNQENGGVKIVAQGNKKDLQELLNHIQKNPGFSKITELNYKWIKPEREYEDFKILKEKNILIDKTKSVLNLGKFILKGKNHAPIHIAIIPDGNRRWAKEKKMDASFGHYKSVNYGNIDSLFKEAKKSGVKYISIWGFSTENWKRDKKEIETIFEIVSKSTEKFLKNSEKDKIRFRHIGRKDRLPKKLLNLLDKLEKETEKFDEFNVNICLDYGGRDEIIRAVSNLIKENKKSLDENDFKKHLDTKDIPDPDLIIRTSGEKRISGFMPFQAAYSELYFTDKYFPDFDDKELRKAIKEYSRRQRRFGGN